MTDGVESFPLVTEATLELLNQKQIVDYRGWREGVYDWLTYFGKDPKKAEGYSEYTVRDSLYRTDRFWRWVWTEYECDDDQDYQYTLSIDHDTADAYMKHLARWDCSASNKASIYRTIQRLYRYLSEEKGQPEWESDIKFSNPSMSQPRDFLTRQERRDIREAAMEYGSIPGYNDLDPEERDRWKIHLAQRFEKPKNDVVPADWDKANGWKIPAIVWTSLDCGLRPVEIKRAKVSWVDTANERLVIPKKESSKNRENWKPPLTSRTAIALENWLEEREAYKKYDDTDELFLTREGNPYTSQSLRYVMKRLFDVADIPQENRQVSWYMIRHSTGTYMAREEGLEAARQQLRHNSAETTMRYDQAPERDRREALDRMG